MLKKPSEPAPKYEYPKIYTTSYQEPVKQNVKIEMIVADE